MKNHLTRVHLGHRPRLETLEDRLPPGDALLGVLIGMAALSCEIDPLNADDRAKASPTLVDEMTQVAVVSRPTRPATEVESSIAAPSLGNFISRNAATQIAEGWHAFAAPDATLTRATSRAATAWHPAMAGVQSLSGLTPAAQGASNGAGGLRGSAVAPSLALRAGVQNSPPREQGATAGDQSRTAENYGKLPLSFEANQGQTDARVDFIARMGSGTVFLTPTAAVFSITQPETVDASARRELVEHGGLAPRRSPETNGAALHMQIVGANPSATPTGQERQPGIVNYFIGNDASQWHANIPTFGRVEYQDVYPGIDLAYYGKDQQLEYDFIVSPGADPNQIAVNFAGADRLETNPQGDLVLHTAIGDVVQQKPFTYQEVGATRQEVASRYVVNGTQVRFEVGAYDATRPLVIDPLVLSYSTFLGGADTDSGRGIAVDSSGYVYVTGSTKSSNFPVTPGAFDQTRNGPWWEEYTYTDAFVTKLNPTGTAVIYSTLLGGNDGEDYGNGIAVDASGNVYVAGVSGGGNFPTTPGAFDTTDGGVNEAFVTKLNATGSALIYSTYLGGSGNDYASGVAIDGNGSAYVTGQTYSGDFPTTPGAWDTTFHGSGDAFVSKLRSDGAGALYSTFLGGSGIDEGLDVAIDSSGSAYVTGFTGSANFPATQGAFDATYNGGTNDFFVTKLNATGAALGYSTFLGGSATEEVNAARADIAVDGSGSAFVTGATSSSDFPTTPGVFDTTYNGGGDGFVTKLRPDGTGLLYSTFMGALHEDAGASIAVDGSGSAYVTGHTASSAFPTTPGAFDTVFNGSYDAFVTKLRADGAGLVYSTFLGGLTVDGGNGIAVDSGGSPYVTGYTTSSGFPTTPGAFDPTYNGSTFDAFVTKFCERACRVPAVPTQVVP